MCWFVLYKFVLCCIVLYCIGPISNGCYLTTPCHVKDDWHRPPFLSRLGTGTVRVPTVAEFRGPYCSHSSLPTQKPRDPVQLFHLAHKKECQRNANGQQPTIFSEGTFSEVTQRSYILKAMH